MQLAKFSHILRPLLCGLTFATAGPFLVFAEREPPIRTGLWVTQKVSENAGALEDFASSIRANHQLTGVCLHVAWKDVEKEAGKPDFSAIDKFVAVLRGIGIKYQRCLKPGARTLPFVYPERAQSFEIRVKNPHRA